MDSNLPKGNDKLFKDEVDPNFGAWLQNPANKFFLYSEGYKEAGELIYLQIISKQSTRNTLVYPLIFNYRQFIELRLKELIIMGNKYIGTSIDYADSHNLSTLWETYKINVLASITTIEMRVLQNVDKLMAQFTKEDPESMHYRYPVSKGPIRKKHVIRKTLDLKNFKEVIDRLIYFLDWQWDMISHYEDLKQEQLSEMFSNYY